MNKNAKRIVSMVLAVGTVSAVAPATNINLLTTKAYASNANKDDYLDSLIVYNEDGEKIKLYKTSEYKDNDKVDSNDVEDSEVYFATTSSKIVSIDTEGPKDKYVKVFKGMSDSAKGKDVGDEIEIFGDSTPITLTVKVYGNEIEDNVRNNDNDDDKYDVLSKYKIKLEYTGTGETSNDGNATTDDIYLERLSVDNKMIDISKSKVDYTYNVDSDVNKVTIRATPEEDNYDVTIDNKGVHGADNYKKTVDLDKGTNEFEIEVEDNNKDRIYNLVINRGDPSVASTISTRNAESYDKIYLNELSIGGQIMDLSESEINYNFNVDSDTAGITIKAEPKEEDYDVTIDGTPVDDVDDYKTTVNLNKGENIIKIDLKNGNEERIYNVIVNKGKVSSASTTASAVSAETDISTIKSNQWVLVNEKWQYNDAKGNAVKNSWIQNYYLLDNGEMATGWVNSDGAWYYLGIDGSRKTGWQSIGGNWYYLDSDGKIKTGWFKDLNGKYYYLNGYGAMVYNTTIDGYKISADGVWTGR